MVVLGGTLLYPPVVRISPSVSSLWSAYEHAALEWQIYCLGQGFQFKLNHKLYSAYAYMHYAVCIPGDHTISEKWIGWVWQMIG